MDKAIDAFHISMLKKLKNLSDKQLEKYKDLIKLKGINKALKNDFAWNEVNLRTYQFKQYDFSDYLIHITKKMLMIIMRNFLRKMFIS